MDRSGLTSHFIIWDRETLAASHAHNASYILSLFNLISIADLSSLSELSYRSEKLLPIVLRELMHYVWHRSENKHSTSLPLLLPSLTPETLFILFICWPACLVVVKLLLVVCCLPWQNLRTVKHRMCARSDLTSSHCCISLHQTANQQSTWHTKEREEVRKRKVMPVSVCTARRDPDWKTVRLFSFSANAARWNRLLFPECLQMTSSLMSVVKLNLRIHTNIKREAI